MPFVSVSQEKLVVGALDCKHLLIMDIVARVPRLLNVAIPLGHKFGLGVCDAVVQHLPALLIATAV